MASNHTASQPYFEHGYLWASLGAAETPTQVSNLRKFNLSKQPKLQVVTFEENLDVSS